MSTSLLALFSEWHLAGYIYTIFLVFARIGGTISLVPGFGEAFISMRTKLFLALGLAAAMQPVVAEPIKEVP